MANIIPLQLSNNEVIAAPDQRMNREEIQTLLKELLGDNVCFFTEYSGQKIVTAEVTFGSSKSFLIMANITFMGGQEGQHPADLKRIQYNQSWKDFYDKYHEKGDVHWMGIYSFNGDYIFADFEPESYLSKHDGKTLITKSGIKANYSCHVFLNDLFQGKEDLHFQKTDRNKNVIHTIAPSFLKQYLSGEKVENNIITVIKEINKAMVPWNEWIMAERAIRYMRSLVTAHEDAPAFDQWRQTKWGGWLLEALYSEYLYNHPSNQICYLATSPDADIRDKYNNGLDLAFPAQNFIGDLKGATINDDGSTLLNDEETVNKALEKYKRIWFVFYLYDSKPGSFNNYEMVEWRNKYLQVIDKKHIKDIHESANTNHSVCYQQMVVIELNDITKDKYFEIGKQYGLNSDGKERNRKYKISKKLLKSIFDDDSFVIYRESHI